VNIITEIARVKDPRWTIQKKSDTEFHVLFNGNFYQLTETFDQAMTVRINASDEQRKLEAS
jgi:hypothetical protein